MNFEPDYKNILDAANNKRPTRLPVYEHFINVEFMEKLKGSKFAELESGDGADLKEFFANYCGFYREMTYDTVSFEACVTHILPNAGALLGEGAGPIQKRADFESYPWDELAGMYWEMADRKFKALSGAMPAGMKGIGGVGNGIFEVSEDLVGFEHLCYMQVDDSQLFADLYVRIGDLFVELWGKFLNKYGDLYAVCRMGDDLGFKTGTLLSPRAVIDNVVPQYKRVIDLVKKANKPFLLHSCGNIFAVMEEIIAAGISAKHSNEDIISPYDKWIELYGDRIGLFGGFDVDLICQKPVDEFFDYVVEHGTKYRQAANGYALGSGNSIPEYVPVEGYLAMIRAAQKIRENEARR